MNRVFFFFIMGCFAAMQTLAQEAVSNNALKIIRKVNDHWQSTHPTHGNAFWHVAAYHTGNMAAYFATGDEGYRKYAEAWAEQNEWKGAKSDDKGAWKFSYGETDDYVLFGDWQICFQTYIDLYKLDPDKQKIARAQEVMEYEMSTPNNNYWWWADGLYMVMPVMTKLYSITENPTYLKKLHEYFSFAKTLMYDPESGLFYRDAKYVYPKHKTVNGKKDFWSRGNGWVFAGLAKVLQDLPSDDPHRQEYIQVFQSMAKALKQAQQRDGYWTRSLLDPVHAPGYETSGTAFFVYGYLWGINHGILDGNEHSEVVQHGWRYLTETALQPDGLVGYVQPIGERADQHKNVNERSTSDFGVGAFLLAASEMTRFTDEGYTTYYLDATDGDDKHSGKSPVDAWKTVNKLKQVSLKAGDKILFKRGATFNGPLEINAAGKSGKRVIIDGYGEGKKPRIIAPDNSLYAVLVKNSDYVTLQNLEIVNKGTQRLAHRTGVKVLCENYGVSHNIVLNQLDIRDVNGSLVKSEGGGSGILIVSGGKDVVSRYDSLIIENCTIRRCERNAIIWSASADRKNWNPSTNTIVRKNLIEEVPGDGIVPIGCDGTLIEYNVMRNSPDILPEKEAAAGIWPWSSDNTVIQFNEVSGHKAPWDAQAYDSDWNCQNTIIQYNYSHDNYGGLALICNAGKVTEPQNIGNIGTMLRYNISINDGIRSKPTHTGKMFSPGIHIAGPVERVLIERNILHANKKSTPDIDRTMIQSDSWDGYAENTIVRENIFYAAEKSSFNMTKSVRNSFERNFYLGLYKTLPEKNAVSTSPFYEKQVMDVGEDGFKGLQRLMNTVDVADGEGMIINKEAIEAFFEQITDH